MGNQIKYRLYKPGDENGILDLLKLSFSGWTKIENVLDYWKWKYLETPIGTDIVVAEDDGKIIGVSHNMELRLKLGSSIILTHFGADTTTHPDYRGKGVFGSIVELLEKIRVEKKLGLEYATSNNPAVHKEWQKRGRIIFPHPISIMVRIKNVNLHLKMRPLDNALFLESGYYVKNTMRIIDNTFKHKIVPLGNFTLEEINKFQNTNNEFWEKIKPNYNFILEKNNDYLNWRYKEPFNKYIIKQATNDKELLGFSVINISEKSDYSEAFIYELIALPNRPDVALALFNDCCKTCDKLNINIIYYMVPKKSSYQKIANITGFLDSERDIFVTCHIIGTQADFEVMKKSSPNQIYFTYADTL
jgi:GNAT superfamily N-acetyltransferase